MNPATRLTTRCGVVYRLTFSNGQQYIGSTIKRLNARMHNHKQKIPSSNSPLYSCWREYGEPAVDLIAGPGLTEAELRDRERKEVSHTPPNLRLNVAPGGMNGAFPGNQAAKGNILSEETRQKMSRAHLGNKSRLGIPHSKEVKARVSASMKRYHGS